MFTDITGIKLTPGNGGDDCLGNGEHYDKKGVLIECCCDECDFASCCLEDACQICKLDACVKKEIYD